MGFGIDPFVEKLRLKERAEEDIFFARHDAELIEQIRAASRPLPLHDRPIEGRTEVQRRSWVDRYLFVPRLAL